VRQSDGRVMRCHEPEMNGGYDPVIDDSLMKKRVCSINLVEITIEESFVVKVQKKLPQ